MTLMLFAAFLTGFFGGNGLPYYFAGSIGEGGNPSPFRDGPTTNVVIGCCALLVAAFSAHWVDWSGHCVPSLASAWVGVLTVGLIHSRNWRTNPWRKAAASPKQ